MNQIYAESNYTAFEKDIALAWANSAYNHWLQEHPNSDGDVRAKTFLECIEGGLSVALAFRDR